MILVRVETSPEDIAGMHSAAGILTTRGGLTSHAAVVARGMGRPCIVGAGALRVDYGKGELRSEGHEPLEEGDWVSIDGSTGEVIGGKLDTRPSEVIQVLLENSLPAEQSETFRNFDRLLKWADEIRTLGVRTNADTPNDARVARLFGAEGIGLCRTEHMFFAEDRILRVREMILARNEAGRRKALDSLLPFQRATSRASSASWTACRSRSACSIRRCTSSCRRASSRSRPSRATWAGASSSCARR